ncbi:MAG TPA: hypothetical protein VFA67_08595, partial [Candidatus Sulfotelmatobacter sp.]|nr:hypothetical protein [Candidatus Sulfotelmatobacter sp.]
SKKRWGADVGHYLNVSFARPWSKGAAYLKTLHHARQGKSWLREHVSASTWELLHNVNVRLKGEGRKPLQGGQPSLGDRTDDPQ